MSEYQQRDTTVIANTPVYAGRAMDHVRWPAVLAGLFVALSTLAVLSVLGIAIGLSSVDGYENRESADNFAIGAGIWGAVSALVAFFVGGLVAAWTAASGRSSGTNDTRTAAGHHDSNDRPIKGWLQGLMVWAVAIPLSAWMVGSAATGLARTAGNAVATGVQATATAADDVADRMGNDASGNTTSATQQANNAAQDAMNRVQSAATPQNIDDASDVAAGTAWGVLISMLLALGAAVGGGAAGSKIRE
jgi:hypothetical protein